MVQSAADVMPNMLKKEPSGAGVQPQPRVTTANGAAGGTISKLRQSSAKFLHKTAQRLSLREETPEPPEPPPAESGGSGGAGGQPAGPSVRQGRVSPSSGAPPPSRSSGSNVKQGTSPSGGGGGGGGVGASEARGPAAAARLERPPSAGAAAKTPPTKKAGTPQPEPRPSANLKRRSASTDSCGSTASGSGSARPRASAVRHRDRPRDGGKVCFAPRVQLLGPSGSEERQERDDSPLAEEQEQERQAESMRRLERENESLRHAIENYRDLERRRAAGGGGSGGAGGSGSDAKGTEDSAEDAEEDEVEKAIEVSPSGVFLKFSEEIGRGSFKAVYKGLDTTTGVFVAWCELQLSGNRLSKKERDRFREEAGLMKGLTHPNIVRFYDFWEVDKPKRSCIVLVTELMTSGTLRTYLKNFGQKRVSLKIIKQWCRQILRGLQFLHSRNPPIIHRDLKCDNIFISGTTGQVKVGDLGLATLKNRSFAKSVIGTPEFMAPEVYEEHYDEAVDVYAFGMCMLEMVTSEYPYSECTGPAQIYKKVITGIKPSSFEKIDDAETRDLIEWCTRLNSKERPTVKTLLNHEFFAEDCGMRLEVANREEAITSSSSVIHLQLRVVDAKKRRDTHKENEAIQFNYVLNKDNPEETAKQMLMSGLLAEENCRPLAKMITNVITSLVRSREERRRDNPVPQSQSVPVASAPPPTSLVPTAAAPVVVPLHLSASLPVISTAHPPPPVAIAFTATSGTGAVTVTVAATQTQSAAVSPSASGTEAAGAATGEGKTGEMMPPPAPVSTAESGPSTATQQPQIETHSDSATGTESDSALNDKKDKNKTARPRRRKTCERLPKLTVLEVKDSDNGPVVSCLLETNQSRVITFKFDLHEADVPAISYKMTEAHQLLPRDDAQYFEEQLRAVIRRQRELRGAGPAPTPPPPPPPHADDATSSSSAQPSDESGPELSTPVSSSGSSSSGCDSPARRRPTDLLPPPSSAPSGQVATGAVPVLVRAPHGLQIVTLTTQQAAALLRQTQAAAAAALLAPVLGAAPSAASGRAASPTPLATTAGGGALTTAVASLPPGLLSSVVASSAAGVTSLPHVSAAAVADALQQSVAGASLPVPLSPVLTVAPGAGGGSAPASPPIDVTAVLGAPICHGVSLPESLTSGTVGTTGGQAFSVPSGSSVPAAGLISAAGSGGSVSVPVPVPVTVSLLPSEGCGAGGHVAFTTPSPVLVAPLPVLGGSEREPIVPASVSAPAAAAVAPVVTADLGTAAASTAGLTCTSSAGVRPAAEQASSPVPSRPSATTPASSTAIASPAAPSAVPSSAVPAPSAAISSGTCSPLVLASTLPGSCTTSTAATAGVGAGPGPGAGARVSASASPCVAPAAVAGAGGAPAASAPPVQTGGRRSRFVVSSVVESRASPMPSPSLQSPASEQPLTILTSAGAATTSVSPSPQLAQLLTLDSLSTPATTPGHSPQSTVEPPASPSAVSAASGAASAVITSVAEKASTAAVTATAPMAIPGPSRAPGGSPVSKASTSGTSPTTGGLPRPPSLSISPRSRSSQAKAGGVPAPAAPRHVRFAVTPTVLNPSRAGSVESLTGAPITFTAPAINPAPTATVTAATAGESTSASSPVNKSPPQQLATPSTSSSATAAAGVANAVGVAGSTTAPTLAVTPLSPVGVSLGTSDVLATPLVSPGALSPGGERQGSVAHSPSGTSDSASPTAAAATGAAPGEAHSPSAATETATTAAGAALAATAAADASKTAPPRPANGAHPTTLPHAGGVEEKHSAAGTGAHEQPPSPNLDSSSSNLAQLAKQLTRLTSQPGEAAGSGTHTPADGAPTARRLTATGAGPTPAPRPDASGGTSSPSQLAAAAASGSPADLSRSSSATDAALAAPGSGESSRRKQVPLHLTDLAKKLDKLRVKQPQQTSSAVQTSTPVEEVPPRSAAHPAVTPGAHPPDHPAGPSDASRGRGQDQADGTPPLVNGSASHDTSPESVGQPVRRGRFAISKAAPATSQPTASSPTTSFPASGTGAGSALTPAQAQAHVEEMALYRELIARQHAAMMELLRQQEMERENLRRQLRQQQQQSPPQLLQQSPPQQQQSPPQLLQQQQNHQQNHQQSPPQPPPGQHPPCTENGHV